MRRIARSISRRPGWNIDYEHYLPSAGDLLPERLVLTRADARVRIAVDHWTAPE